jgi:molybdopterin biosynthesis enzyme
MTMRPFTSTISITEARAIIEAGMPVIARRERVPLSAASGRVVAEDVVATFDVPPFDRASMDGYAVKAEDTTDASRIDPRSLMLAGRVYTGYVPTGDRNKR